MFQETRLSGAGERIGMRPVFDVSGSVRMPGACLNFSNLQMMLSNEW